MAVNSCSFHQAFLPLLQLHTAQQPFFPSLHMFPALSPHKISPFLCHFITSEQYGLHGEFFILQSKSRLKDMGLSVELWLL